MYAMHYITSFHFEQKQQKLFIIYLLLQFLGSIFRLSIQLFAFYVLIFHPSVEYDRKYIQWAMEI